MQSSLRDEQRDEMDNRHELSGPDARLRTDHSQEFSTSRIATDEDKMI